MTVSDVYSAVNVVVSD